MRRIAVVTLPIGSPISPMAGNWIQDWAGVVRGITGSEATAPAVLTLPIGPSRQASGQVG